MNNRFKENLDRKIKNKTAVVGIFGLGYVGLPLALRFAEVGFTVIGFDIDSRKVDSLASGISYIEQIESTRIKKVLNKTFSATTDFDDAISADALIVCVPTPLTKCREPDLSFITNTVEELKTRIRPGQIISLESTTYPGTTEEEIIPRVLDAGFVVGDDVFVVYSPEREDPGNKSFSTQTIPKVVGGYTEVCADLGVALYGAIVDAIVPVSSLKTAEMTKLLENIYRAVNIGLVNEMKMVADKMGVDIYEVVDAAATKPFGFTPYYPGPGLGGHCIPIDPFYLTWKAREYDLSTRFIELAGEVNTAMPAWVLNKVSDALNSRSKSIRGSRVLILGLAYKADVDDTRGSPAIALMKSLSKKGAMVEYSDPYIPRFTSLESDVGLLDSVKLSQKNISKYDAVILVTNHRVFNYKQIQTAAKLLIDTRGVYRELFENVVRA